MKRKLAFFWVTIPCEKQVGTCYYQNVCTLSPYKNDPTCPKLFNDFHLPCRCPVLEVNNMSEILFNIINIFSMICIFREITRLKIWESIFRQFTCLNFLSMESMVFELMLMMHKIVTWAAWTFNFTWNRHFSTILQFIYSEKATKFCEVSTNYLTGST